MTTPARWWVAGSDNRIWGPFEAAAMHAYLRDGRIRPGDMICEEGGTTWQAANTVAEFIPTTGVAVDPFAPGPPPAVSAGPAPLDVRELQPEDLMRVSPAGTVLLAIFTLGIYGYVAFYKLALRYRRLAGIASSYFESLFWVYIALVIGTPFVRGLGIGALLIALVLLNHVLGLRYQAWLRVAPGEYPPRAFRSLGWHATLLAAPAVLVTVGLVLLAFRAVNQGRALDLDHLDRTIVRAALHMAFVFACASIPAVVQAARVFIEWNAVADVLRARASGRDG